MSTTIALDEIPGPRGLPLVGNAFDIDATNPIEGLMEMAGEYGPIFRLATPGGTRLIVSGAELVDELCDESHASTSWSGAGSAACAKGAAGAGLFTAETAGPAVAARPQHPAARRSACRRCATTCPRCSTSPTS